MSIIMSFVQSQFAGFKYSYPILIIFKQIYLALLDTITPGQSGPENNDNKRMTIHSLNLDNWSLTTRHSLISYLGHLFLL